MNESVLSILRQCEKPISSLKRLFGETADMSLPFLDRRNRWLDALFLAQDLRRALQSFCDLIHDHLHSYYHLYPFALHQIAQFLDFSEKEVLSLVHRNWRYPRFLSITLQQAREVRLCHYYPTFQTTFHGNYPTDAYFFENRVFIQSTNGKVIEVAFHDNGCVQRQKKILLGLDASLIAVGDRYFVTRVYFEKGEKSIFLSRDDLQATRHELRKEVETGFFQPLKGDTTIRITDDFCVTEYTCAAEKWVASEKKKLEVFSSQVSRFHLWDIKVNGKFVIGFVSSYNSKTPLLAFWNLTTYCLERIIKIPVSRTKQVLECVQQQSRCWAVHGTQILMMYSNTRYIVIKDLSQGSWSKLETKMGRLQDAVLGMTLSCGFIQDQITGKVHFGRVIRKQGDIPLQSSYSVYVELYHVST